jgi:Fibronectin type III domain
MSRIRVAALAVIGGLMAASVMVPAQAQPADDGKATNVTAINIDGGLDVSWTKPVEPGGTAPMGPAEVTASLDNSVNGQCFSWGDNCTIMPLYNGYTYQITVCYTYGQIANGLKEQKVCSDPVEGYTQTMDPCELFPGVYPFCPGYVDPSADPCVTDPQSSPSCPGYVDPNTDPCVTDPQSSPSCPGYVDPNTDPCVTDPQSCPDVDPSADPCVTDPQSSPSCPGYVAPATVPSAPVSGGSVGTGPGQITVSWGDSVTDGGAAIDAYYIDAWAYRGQWESMGRFTADASARSYVFDGLTSGTAYGFYVVPHNSVGDGDWVWAGQALAWDVPGAPSDVSAVAGDGEATVSWSAPSSDGGSAVTGYTVTASPGGETCSTDGELSCTVSGLDNLVFYTFTVTATNAAGDSVASDASDRVVPHTDEFQVWLPNATVARDADTQVFVFGAMGVDTVKVRIGREVFEATPDEFGTAVVDYNASNSSVTVPYGKVRVTATGVRVADGSKEKLRATALFFAPKTTVKSRVRSGGQVVVRVRAANPGSSFSFRIHGVQVCTADADERGWVVCSFDAPEAGDYTVETFVGDLFTGDNDFTVLTGRRPV